MADVTEKTIATENPDACSRCGTTRENLHVFESRPGVPFCADCAAEMLAPGGDGGAEKAIADELREAAARAREHLLPQVTAEVLPQTAIVAVCGSVHDESEAACRNCVLFDVKDRVLVRLVATLINAREPLAAWLEKTADGYATAMEEIDCPGCGEVPACRHPAEAEFCQTCDDPAPCRCVASALAVARVLNGTPQDVSRG